MGTLNAFYVRANGDSTLAAIRKQFAKAEIESGLDFIGVTLATDVAAPPIGQLSELSSSLATDVFWLSFQSVVDAFEFHHWRAGQALRSLVYGCREQGIWECVEGQMEAWEREAFFRPYSPKLVVPEDQRRERERICREAVLLPGRFEPCINARESARKAAEYYHFPGWS
jgi:hypothetical protein